MKLLLVTVKSSATTQRLQSFKFTLVNKSHSQHCGFQPKYHDNWSGSETSAHELSTHMAGMVFSVVVGKVYEHDIGKVLNSAANL